MRQALFPSAPLLLAVCAALHMPGGAPTADAKPAPPPAVAPEVMPDTLRNVLAGAQYHLTPPVKTAYLAYMEAKSQQELAAAGKTLPADFLAWVDSDPVIQTTVYGSRQSATNILLVLRSLELDLGQPAVRQKYTQLALATAVVLAKEGPTVNLAPRPLLQLVISGDPRQPVNTKDPRRPLDVNDHIINFLNDHPPIVVDVVVGKKEELPELKYDDKGVAIPVPKGKAKKVPIIEKRSRPIVAADVLASKTLQNEFNDYMKAKGQTVQIDCGDHVIYWDRHDMIPKAEGQGILAAYHLFRTAYEAKGLLPAQRDPAPTPAERCAYLIRNNEYQFPPEDQAQRHWPRYPLTAPWPTLTLLVADGQSLREREDIWLRFRDKGELHTYGEYIGGIAQQFDFQSARRLEPWPFTYGTIQMMLKDGGVCGTMANIAVRSYNTLGIPSTTAGQPGHCALISFGVEPKTGLYNCHGGQYVTGGDEQTHPHTPWYFGDLDTQRDMVYHQSIAWAVNYGFQSYLDSTLAWQLFRQLPEADRQAHGQALLESGLAINPYNFLLTDGAQAIAAAPQDQIAFWRTFQAALPANKPGCPATGLYNKIVQQAMFTRLAKMPVPTDKAVAGAVYAFLQKENCDNPSAMVAYDLALNGLPKVLENSEQAFKDYLANISAKGLTLAQTNSELMARRIQAVAGCMADKKLKQQWATTMWAATKGHEKYFGHKYEVLTDATVPLLAKLSGQPMPTEAAMLQALLEHLTTDLRALVAGERDLTACRQLAAELTATAKVLTDAAQKHQWIESLAQIMTGHETFPLATAKKNAKPRRDPCADAIAELRNAPKT